MAAGKDGAEPVGESADAEVVGEVQAGRQSHARRVGIDFPGVHREHGGLTAPVPVFFVYQTAFIDQNGALEFRPDVYQRDEEVWAHLRRATQAPVAEREQAGQRRG